MNLKEIAKDQARQFAADIAAGKHLKPQCPVPPPAGYKAMQGIEVTHKMEHCLSLTPGDHWMGWTSSGMEAKTHGDSWFAIRDVTDKPESQVPPSSALAEQIGGQHYKGMAIQPVEFITANGIPYLEGNVIKYVCRHRDKNGAQDIDKAIHYLRLLREMVYEKKAAATK